MPDDPLWPGAAHALAANLTLPEKTIHRTHQFEIVHGHDRRYASGTEFVEDGGTELMIDIVQMHYVRGEGLEGACELAPDPRVVERANGISQPFLPAGVVVVACGNQPDRSLSGAVERMLSGKHTHLVTALPEPVFEVIEDPFGAATRIVEFVYLQNPHAPIPIHPVWSMPEAHSQDEVPESFLRLADGPEITTKVKGSRFVGQAFSANSGTAALARLETIRKRYHDATHHCWAAMWGPPENTEERFDDDGEPPGSAGRPILHHLKGAGVCDGIVVVTRWFGGTKLGTGGLVQAYSEAARLALQAAGRVRVHRQVPLRLVLAYEDLGAVEAILARRQEWVWKVERDFGDSPAFLVHVRHTRVDPLQAELIERLSGRVRIETFPSELVER